MTCFFNIIYNIITFKFGIKRPLFNWCNINVNCLQYVTMKSVVFFTRYTASVSAWYQNTSCKRTDVHTRTTARLPSGRLGMVKTRSRTTNMELPSRGWTYRSPILVFVRGRREGDLRFDLQRPVRHIRFKVELGKR